MLILKFWHYLAMLKDQVELITILSDVWNIVSVQSKLFYLLLIQLDIIYFVTMTSLPNVQYHCMLWMLYDACHSSFILISYIFLFLNSNFFCIGLLFSIHTSMSDYYNLEKQEQVFKIWDHTFIENWKWY